MLVFSQYTFAPLAVLLDGGLLTELRTAAAGALAARLFAPRRPGCIGVLGCGVQARYQLRMLAAVTACRAVVVWARRAAQAQALAAELQAEGWDATVAATPREACHAAGILLTVTPSRAPLVELDWVQGRPVLILAIGADSVGKQELAVGVVEAADLLVLDSRAQCAERGEAQHAVARGSVVLGGPRGEAGARPGGVGGARRQPRVVEIGECVDTAGDADAAGGGSGVDRAAGLVIFDSTGVAVQDVAIAELALHVLRARAGPTARL